MEPHGEAASSRGHQTPDPYEHFPEAERQEVIRVRKRGAMQALQRIARIIHGEEIDGRSAPDDNDLLARSMYENAMDAHMQVALEVFEQNKEVLVGRSADVISRQDEATVRIHSIEDIYLAHSIADREPHIYLEHMTLDDEMETLDLTGLGIDIDLRVE